MFSLHCRRLRYQIFIAFAFQRHCYATMLFATPGYYYYMARLPLDAFIALVIRYAMPLPLRRRHAIAFAYVRFFAPHIDILFRAARGFAAMLIFHISPLFTLPATPLMLLVLLPLIFFAMSRCFAAHAATPRGTLLILMPLLIALLMLLPP